MSGSRPSDTQAAAMIAVASSFMALCLIAVSLRVYVRAYMIRNFGWDDWLMLISLAFFILYCSYLILLARCATITGVRSMDWLETIVAYVTDDMIFYVCTSIMLKLSLAAFFLRVAMERWHRMLIYVGTFIYTGITFSYLVIIATHACNDAGGLLAHQLPHNCLPWSKAVGPLAYTKGALNMLTDWIFAILPLFILRGANMPLQAKISIGLVLSLATLGSIVSAARMAFISDLDSFHPDFFRRLGRIAIMSTIQLGLGIIAGSLATLRPLLKLVATKWRYLRSCSRPNKDSSIPRVSDSCVAAETPSDGPMEQKSFGQFVPYGFVETVEKSMATTTAERGSVFCPTKEQERENGSFFGSLPQANRKISRFSNCTNTSNAMWPEPHEDPQGSPSGISSLQSQKRKNSGKESLVDSQYGSRTDSEPRLSVAASSHKGSSREPWAELEAARQDLQRRIRASVGSLQSSVRRTSFKDHWTDLEAAKEHWQGRTHDEGEQRVVPNLLLPDPDLEENSSENEQEQDQGREANRNP